jgi:2-(1,2-epoxy-1,2-dihydrophenyl)acetyl-CoA isomerase
MVDEFAEAISDLRGARAVLLTGAGRAFCAGADVSGSSASAGGSPGDHAYRSLAEHYNPLMLRLSELKVPFVSAVRGAAAGVGCSMALAADFCVASETAYFLQAFVKVGLVPDGGASWMLPRLVGRTRALRMMMLGEKITAARALEWGMIHQVVSDGVLDEVAFTFASELASGPTTALGLIRLGVSRAANEDYPAAMLTEAENQREARDSIDATEGMRAFRERRRPEFSGL